MKKYSNLYPLIFGIICVIVGIVVEEIKFSIFFGGIPIVIAGLLMWSDYKQKKNGKETSTEKLNREYQGRKQKATTDSCKKATSDIELQRLKSRCFYENYPNSYQMATVDNVQKKETKKASAYVHKDYAESSDTPVETAKSPICISPNEKENAIKTLRENIIQNITKTPSTEYELASLLWDAAAKCFPTDYSFKWDGAWFKLDLKTMGLYADVSTYPNQFGACREEKYTLTASVFHHKAVEFNMSKNLQCMETDEDWHKLFNDELKTAVVNAEKILAERREKCKQAERIANAVVIPDSLVDAKPAMDFDEIVIELHQRYGSNSVRLIKGTQKYVLKYFYSATYANNTENSRRELSSSEAAWVEQRVNACIENPDKKTWQSLAGGDSMTVKIYRQNNLEIELIRITPLDKFYELKHDLQALANYGSFSETEAKKLRK